MIETLGPEMGVEEIWMIPEIAFLVANSLYFQREPQND
jgi:hypothetical protein